MVLLTAAQSRWLFILIVIVLPLTVIAIGGAVWWSRR
jgi:flagellar basal body-associated protein FliL